MTVIGVAGVLPARAAWADPAGPTDYTSTVEAIDPPSDGVQAEVIGVDAFLQLTVEAGVDVIVSGYWGEPFLHIDPDGSVFENAASPTPPQNANRYGDPDASPDVLPDPDAPPEWRLIGSGGTSTWHDHRIHWMARTAAPITGAGGLVQRWTVDLLINGSPATIAGRLERHDSPSPWWWVIALLGLVAAWRIRGRGVIVLVTAVVVGGILAVNRLSLSAVARPGWPPVLLIGFAAVLALVAAPGGWRRWWSPPLLAGSGCALFIGAALERSAVTHAFVPGTVPDVAVRVAVIAALGIGAGIFLRSSGNYLTRSNDRVSGHQATTGTGH